MSLKGRYHCISIKQDTLFQIHCITSTNIVYAGVIWFSHKHFCSCDTSDMLLGCIHQFKVTGDTYVFSNRTIKSQICGYITQVLQTNSSHSFYRYKDKYSKATGNWSTVPAKVPKMYNYIDDLIMDVLNKRELGETSLDTRATMLLEDPQRLRRNIATAPRPKKAQLIERHKSRFSK